MRNMRNKNKTLVESTKRLYFIIVHYVYLKMPFPSFASLTQEVGAMMGREVSANSGQTSVRVSDLQEKGFLYKATDGQGSTTFILMQIPEDYIKSFTEQEREKVLKAIESQFSPVVDVSNIDEEEFPMPSAKRQRSERPEESLEGAHVREYNNTRLWNPPPSLPPSLLPLPPAAAPKRKRRSEGEKRRVKPKSSLSNAGVSRVKSQYPTNNQAPLSGYNEYVDNLLLNLNSNHKCNTELTLS